MKRIWLGIFAGIVLGEAVLNMLVPDQKEISRSQAEGRISGIDERDGKLVLYVDDVMVWADAGCAADFVLPKCIGNKVLVTGDIEAIEGPRNPGEFDYRTYYRSLGTVTGVTRNGFR